MAAARNFGSDGETEGKRGTPYVNVNRSRAGHHDLVDIEARYVHLDLVPGAVHTNCRDLTMQTDANSLQNVA